MNEVVVMLITCCNFWKAKRTASETLFSWRFSKTKSVDWFVAW